MATKHKKKPRGSWNKSNVNTAGTPIDDELVAEDLMTHEDIELLRGVDDRDESDVEVEANGSDVSESEISSFLQKLGVEKYRPFPAASNNHQEKADKNKSNAETRMTAENKKKNQNSKHVSHGINGIHPDMNNKNQVNKARPVLDLATVQSVVKFLQVYKTRKHLLLRPEEMWREEQVHQLPDLPPDERLVHEAENLAQRLLEDEVSLYSKQRENSKRSEARWLKTVLNSGTLSDKMAALTLLIQESPVHNLASLDTLISMAGKKGRREAMMAVDTLRDLFLTGLLPDDRKLRAFNQQPFMELLEMTSGNIEARDKCLVMWHVEALLKKKYGDFIKALGDMSSDTLQATKEKALSSIHQLLTSKPEQENILLPMLVNKLGDPSVKSKATYLLSKLVGEHPNMKSVIVREVQQLLHRPNVSERAQYYALCFLAQLRLSQAHADLASQLIHIYFYFFQTYLRKGDIDSKMMSTILTGVNRAYVYAKDKKEEIAEQLDAIYKIIPSVNFHTSVQALMLLYQVSNTNTNISDRYYTSLYHKLADPALTHSSKQAIFMNLLFKSMRADNADRRIRAFAKRTLQVYSQQPPQIICGVLIHLSQLLKDKPGLLDIKHIAEGVWSDDEEEKFVDLPAPEEFDVLEKSGRSSHGEDESDIDKEDSGTQQKNDGHETVANNVKGSWIHRVNFGGAGRSSSYDPYGRNPLYARAELDCIWELERLVRHYHPTVRLYAGSVLQGKPIAYDGDPLEDYTLIRFLDKFVYKNPKKESASSATSHFRKIGPSGIHGVPVNSKEFLEMDEANVPEDEKFFFRYFTERAIRKKQDGGDMDSDGGSVADEEFDAFLDTFEKDADGDDDVDDMDLDFAGDTYRSKSKSDKKKRKDSDEEDEEIDDEDVDLEDEELAMEFQEEMGDLGLGDDDDGGDGDDGDEVENTLSSSGWQEVSEMSSDEEGEPTSMTQGGNVKKRKKPQTEYDDKFETTQKASSKKFKKKLDTADLFASAEEFAHLLEENTETGQISLGGSGDVRNKDKAAQKQLQWEADRDRWVKNKNGGHRKKDFKVSGGRNHKNVGKRSFGKTFKAGKNKLYKKKGK